MKDDSGMRTQRDQRLLLEAAKDFLPSFFVIEFSSIRVSEREKTVDVEKVYWSPSNEDGRCPSDIVEKLI